jgi:hypothetical protein
MGSIALGTIKQLQSLPPTFTASLQCEAAETRARFIE